MYLSYERVDVAVFEVLRQHAVLKAMLVMNDEAFVVGCPTDNMGIFRCLRK